MAERLRRAPSNPKLGGTPPSIRRLHNSTRCAPPGPGAMAERTESAQTSSITGSFIRLLLDHSDELRRKWKPQITDGWHDGPYCSRIRRWLGRRTVLLAGPKSTLLFKLQHHKFGI